MLGQNFTGYKKSGHAPGDDLDNFRNNKSQLVVWGFDNLLLGLPRKKLLRDQFDAHNHQLLELKLKDWHAHNLLKDALLITLLWNKSHNFTDLLHDLRNKVIICGSTV